MKKEDVIRKIKALLALANDKCNESESTNALLKAQALMVQYGIHIQETEGPGKVDVVITEEVETKWNMGYRLALAATLSRNFRCERYINYNKKIVFVGTEIDAKICKEAYEYIYLFIYREGNRCYAQAAKEGKQTKGVFNSYATGFMNGLRTALEKQSTELMVITPDAVIQRHAEIVKGGKSVKSSIRTPNGIDADFYHRGVHDGKTVMNGVRVTG